MIAKTVKGAGFSGAQTYIYQKDGAELLHTNNLFTSNHAQEMRIAAEVSSIVKPVLHTSLSLPEGEKGTAEQWIMASEAWLIQMGVDLEKTQYSITRHIDGKHDHVHILANRVMFNGKVNHLQNDYKKSHEAARTAEVAAGFQTFDSQAAASKKGKIYELRQSIDQALKSSFGDLYKFKATLKISQIEVVEHRQSTGRLSGLSFQKADEKLFKGSEIGKAYSASGLAKRGLELSQPTNSQKSESVSVKFGRFGSSVKPHSPASLHYVQSPQNQGQTMVHLTREAEAAGDLDLIIRKRREYQM